MIKAGVERHQGADLQKKGSQIRLNRSQVFKKSIVKKAFQRWQSHDFVPVRSVSFHVKNLSKKELKLLFYGVNLKLTSSCFKTVHP